MRACVCVRATSRGLASPCVAVSALCVCLQVQVVGYLHNWTDARDGEFVYACNQPKQPNNPPRCDPAEDDVDV